MTTWFTADTHFGHSNIIRHCQRPFGDAAEMDAVLIANWNAVVQPGDTVWHLGDFAFRSARAPMDYLQRLTGAKHLVWGNHDNDACKQAPGWASSQAYAEVSVNGHRLMLFHYSMRVWNRAHHGALHLYGHSHGALPGDRQSVDVGVDYDAWGMRPVSLKEILNHLETLPERLPVDHHGR